MSMDEITAYLMGHDLDNPDPELDVYRHLKVGLKTLPADAGITEVEDEISELGVVDVTEFATTLVEPATVEELVEALKPIPSSAPVLILDQLDPPEASTAVSNSSDFVTAIEPVKVPSEVRIVASGSVNRKANEILKAAAKKSEPVSTGKRGRKDQHDVSDLKVGEHVLYEGILSSARVMASLKGKKYGKKRLFKATEVGNEIHITRTL